MFDTISRWGPFVLSGLMLLQLGCSSQRYRYRYRNRLSGFSSGPQVPHTGKPKPRPLAPRVKKKKPARVFIFLDRPQFSGKGQKQLGGLNVGTLLWTVIKNRLQRFDTIALKSYRELPHLSQRLASYKNFESLDRVTMVQLKQKTGLDGVIQLRYSIDRGEMVLTSRYVDLINGKIYRTRTLTEPVGSRLINVLEADTGGFASSLRRTYRASLRVNVTPTDAQVLVDGRLRGKTPLTLELKQGPHTIEIRRKGYKTMRRRYVLRDGQDLRVDATLYTPMANYMLTRKKSLKPDAHDLQLGYRFVYLIKDPLNIEGQHFMTLDYLLQLNKWSLGFKLGLQPVRGRQRFDTVFGPGEGQARQKGSGFMAAFQLRRSIWDIFSYLQLYGSLELGFMRYNVGGQVNWTVASGLYVGSSVRLSRRRNFSFELNLEVGFAYNGEMKYDQRSQNLFGDAFRRRRTTPAFGPVVGLSMVFKFWNKIF